MMGDEWSATGGIVAVAMVCVVSAWGSGCDRTRLLEDGESATETQPVVTAEDLAGDWRIIETAMHDAGKGAEPLGHASATGWVRLMPGTPSDEARESDADDRQERNGDVGPGREPKQATLRAKLCDERGCQQPLERVTLRRQDDEWRTRYGIAQPGSGPRVASVCAMRVVTWVMRPEESDEQSGSIDRLMMTVSEVRGELTLEGEARCRGEDAVENVDRLTDAELTRTWTLERAAQGSTRQSTEDARSAD